LWLDRLVDVEVVRRWVRPVSGFVAEVGMAEEDDIPVLRNVPEDGTGQVFERSLDIDIV
jgi:hypothetical protein